MTLSQWLLPLDWSLLYMDQGALEDLHPNCPLDPQTQHSHKVHQSQGSPEYRAGEKSYTLFTLHTKNGFTVLEPFSGDSMNASVFILELFSLNGFAFCSEMSLEPFLSPCECNHFRKWFSSFGRSLFLQTHYIIDCIFT